MALVAMDDLVELKVEADPESGRPPLLFINALGTNLHLWDGQMEPFRAHFRVIRYDTRGHGASEVPRGPYSIERLGRDALGVLDALAIPHARIVGLSKGGVEGAWLAANAPSRVDRLVTCGSLPKLSPPEMWTERAAAAREKGMTALIDGVMGRWFTEGFRTMHPGKVQPIKDMVLRAHPEGYAAVCEALRDLDLTETVKSIACPVLVTTGEHDPAVTPEKAEAFAATIPGAEYKTIPAASHIANVEAKAAFDEIVLDFLKP